MFVRLSCPSQLPLLIDLAEGSRQCSMPTLPLVRAVANPHRARVRGYTIAYSSVPEKPLSY